MAEIADHVWREFVLRVDALGFRNEFDARELIGVRLDFGDGFKRQVFTNDVCGEFFFDGDVGALVHRWRIKHRRCYGR